MSVSVITGLTVQAAAVWIMHVGVRGRWLSHIGAIFLAVAVGYHGVTEVMQWLVPGRNPYRKFISQQQLDDWLIVVSLALLLYAAAYVAVIRRPQAVAAPAYFTGVRPKWLIVAAVPLLALTVAGNAATAYQEPGTERTGSAYVIAGVTEQFLILVVGFAAAAVVAHRGAGWLLGTLVVEAAVLSLGGDRRSIVFGCLITLYGLYLAGVKLPRKTLAVGVVSSILLVLAVSASRDAVGRQQFGEGQGAGARGAAILAGGDALGSSAGWEGVKDETIYRLDGNTFGTLIFTELGNDVPPVGLATVWNTIKLSVPSFVYPAKKDQPIESRDEETYLITHFAIGYKDYIPGTFGSVVGYFGRWGLLILATLIGLIFAAADRWIRREPTAPRLAFGSGMVLAVLLYEQGAQGIIVNTRGALFLAAAFWMAPRLWKKRSQHVGGVPLVQPGSQI